jgi:hypothetical protein
VACWYPFDMVCANKRTDTVLAFLLAAWKEVGLPGIAQFDNEMSFTGGRWAHRLGRMVRLCLALGIQVWFILPTRLSGMALSRVFIANATSSSGHAIRLRTGLLSRRSIRLFCAPSVRSIICLRLRDKHQHKPVCKRSARITYAIYRPTSP